MYRLIALIVNEFNKTYLYNNIKKYERERECMKILKRILKPIRISSFSPKLSLFELTFDLIKKY